MNIRYYLRMINIKFWFVWQRYIFQTNDEFAAAYFDDNYKNVDEINYQTFVDNLVSSGANATVDEQVRDLPFKSTQFYGGFDVLAVEDAEREFIVDGEPVVRTVKLYTLNKLTYTDGEKALKDISAKKNFLDKQIDDESYFTKLANENNLGKASGDNNKGRLPKINIPQKSLDFLNTVGKSSIKSDS